ncbi:hypothetical protein TWF481_002688 [Arthrobotrys musiformis]|uniref:Uncharacterized protein n=1 Tax=Arthrobotrys musiformis TaxID=47236 RepID=A0AAV9VX40_9PEZI
MESPNTLAELLSPQTEIEDTDPSSWHGNPRKRRLETISPSPELLCSRCIKKRRVNEHRALEGVTAAGQIPEYPFKPLNYDHIYPIGAGSDIDLPLELEEMSAGTILLRFTEDKTCSPFDEKMPISQFEGASYAAPPLNISGGVNNMANSPSLSFSEAFEHVATPSMSPTSFVHPDTYDYFLRKLELLEYKVETLEKRWNELFGS